MLLSNQLYHRNVKEKIMILEFMVNWENFVATMPLAYHDTIQMRLSK